jgi:acetyltransferase-like isoleucine patch superfamily enzyme
MEHAPLRLSNGSAMRRLALGAMMFQLKRLGAQAARLRIRPLTAALRVELGPDVQIEGRLWIPGTGRIHIGRGVRFRARRAPIELRAHDGGEIWIDDGVVVEAGASIEATERIEIGAGVSIGSFAKIMDNHYHRTVGDRNERPRGIPISIGKDALIGPRAILLPGASLADRAVVAPGEVLSIRQEAKPSSRRPLHAARRVA